VAPALEFDRILAVGQSLPQGVRLENLTAWVRRIRSPLTVFDFETTGLSLKWARVTQVGLVHVPVSGEIRTLEQFVNPERKVPQETIRLNGITREMVQDSPTWQTAWRDVFHSIATSHVTAGYNSRHFDCRIAVRLNKKYGRETEFLKHIDVMRVPEIGQGKLQTAVKRHGLRFHGRHHHALADALATAELLDRVILTESDENLYGSGKSSPRKAEHSRRTGHRAHRLKDIQALITSGTWTTSQAFAERAGLKPATIERDIAELVEHGQLQPTDILPESRVQTIVHQLQRAISEVWQGRTWGKLKPVKAWLSEHGGDDISWFEIRICRFTAGAERPHDQRN